MRYRVIGRLCAAWLSLCLFAACAPNAPAGGTTSAAPQTTGKTEETSASSVPAETADTEETTTLDAAMVYIAVYGPEDAVVLPRTALPLENGMTAVDALACACAETDVPLSVTGAGAFRYIAAIGSYREYDYGGLSGWVYAVNGVYMTSGAGGRALTAGDDIAFYYTKNMGQDIRDRLQSAHQGH